MSDQKTPEGKAGCAETESPKDDGQYHGVPRRGFLGGLLGSAVAGGVALAYAPPEARAAPADFDPLCGTGDVPWDENPFDSKAVIEAAQIMASYKYSGEAARNIEALTPVAQRWIDGGARALNDQELAAVYDLGWLPTSELNADPEVRAKVNAALRFKDTAWAPKGDNQGDYERPLPAASRSRLTRFEAGVEVQSLACIIVGILIVILVVDFPTPTG